MKKTSKCIICSIIPVIAGLLLLGAGVQRATALSLLWSDDFAQGAGLPPDSAKWNYETGGGGWGNGELEIYTTDLANCETVDDPTADDGQALYICCTTSTGQWNGQWYSARIDTAGKQIVYPGTEIKFHLRGPIGPSGAQGYWPACWLLGSNIGSVGWPACGEIDVMEEANGDNTIHQSLHMPGWDPTVANNVANANDYFPCAADWPSDGSYIKFWLNGTSTATFTKAACPGTWEMNNNTSFYILLNVAIGGSSTGFTGGGPDSSTVVGRGMHVDWVRAYSYP
jgi:beta-glucanase (GH16 family)